MAIPKCPRCELNYILDGGALCQVCFRETRGEASQEVLEICPVCNENPVLPRKDMCFFCLKEMNAAAESEAAEPVISSPLALEEPSEIDEIDLDPKDDAPDTELSEIGRELSLEDVLAEENEAADDLEEEDEM